MTTQYTINTPLRNYFFYKDEPNIGQPLTDGYLVFRNDADHNEFLAVYSDVSDPDNPVQYPTVEIIISGETVQAVQLDGDGGIPPIYLLPQPYFIQCYSVELSFQWDIEHYEGPILVPPEPPPVGDTGITNLILDGQFLYGLSVSPPQPDGYITSTGWYSEGAELATGTFSFVAFPAGDDSIPASPVYAIRYVNATTNRDGIYQNLANVRSLEQETLTVSLWAKSAISGTIAFIYEQHFGDGGSATVSNVVLSENLTETYTQYHATFTIPSIAGKTIGPNSFLRFFLDMGSNQASNNYITNVLLTVGSTLEEYPYLTPAQVWSTACKFTLANVSNNSLAEQAWLAGSELDGASQISYDPNPGITELTPRSVRKALDLLMAQNPQNFPGSIYLFRNPAPRGNVFYGVNSIAVATGGAESTTDPITATAGSGHLYLSVTLPAPSALSAITTALISINVCIPGFIPGTTPGNVGAIAIDVNGTRENIFESGALTDGSATLQHIATADVGSNVIEVYYGRVTAATTTSVCANLTATPFVKHATLTAQYITQPI